VASSGERTLVAYEDETVDNRYSAKILQICKYCRMLIKSRLCSAGVKVTQNSLWKLESFRQYFSMREIGEERKKNF